MTLEAKDYQYIQYEIRRSGGPDGAAKAIKRKEEKRRQAAERARERYERGDGDRFLTKAEQMEASADRHEEMVAVITGGIDPSSIEEENDG